MMHLTFPTRRGSIYLITLVTVAAIVSMVLIGMSLRMANNSRSALIEQMTEGNNSVLDATEYAFATLDSDPIWRVSSQSGTIFPTLSIGDNTLTGTVTDATTSLSPTYDTTTYRLKLSSVHGTAKSANKIDVLATQYDYLGYLKTLLIKHYWPLDEHSNPTQALDHKKSYHGTYQVPAVAGASYNNQGGPVPVFAMTGDHVQIPWGSDFNMSEGSISLWLKLTGTNKFTENYAFNKFTENYAFLGMLYTLNGVPALNMAIQQNAIYVYLDDKGKNTPKSSLNTMTDTITVDIWHHIAVTWGQKGLTIYIDGTQKARDKSNTNKLKTDKILQGGEQPLHIGGGYDMRQLSTPADGFVGSISHVAFFDKQLSAGEIAALAAVKPDLRTYSLVKDSWFRLYNQ